MSTRRSARGAAATLTVIASLVLPLGLAQAGPPPEPEAIPTHTIPSAHQFGTFGTARPDMMDMSGLAMDAAGQVYIADCALRRVQIFSVAGRFVGSIGGPGDEAGGLACPKGLALTPDGKLLALDAAAHRVQTYDLASGQVLGPLLDDGRLVAPHAIATDGKVIVVSDPGAQTLHVYDVAGRHLRSCGTAGEEPGNFAAPLGLDLDPDGNVYVADQQNARIQHLRQDCSVIRTWGQYGSLAGQLAEPADVRVADGTVYVADLTNHRLQAFDPAGGFLYQWGRHPSERHEGHGRTHYPALVAVDGKGTNAVVCEPIEVRCQTFDLDVVRTHYSTADDPAWWNKFPRFHYGTSSTVIETDDLPWTDGTVRPFRGLAISEPDTSMVAVLDWTGAEPKLHSMIGGFGSGPGKLKQPSGTVFDPRTKELFVSDSNNHRVQVFTLDGKLLRSFGQFGAGPGAMNGPAGLDFDEDGNLLIAQAHANRIDVYSKGGQYLRSIGRSGAGPLEFNLPLGVRYNARLKRIYVNDVYNQRVQILSHDGRYISEFGGRGTESGRITDSIQTAIDRENNVYLSDTSTSRVLKFDQDGKLLAQWGSWGSELGQFYKPKGMSVLHDRLMVIDFGNHRGQILTFDGRALGVFGEGVLFPATGVEGGGAIVRTTAGQPTTSTVVLGGLAVAAAATAAAGLWATRRRRSAMRPDRASGQPVTAAQAHAGGANGHAAGGVNGHAAGAPDGEALARRAAVLSESGGGGGGGAGSGGD